MIIYEFDVAVYGQSYSLQYLLFICFREMKIVLKGEDAAHLTMLAGQAQALDLPHYVVQDAGKTQVDNQDN